MTVLLCRGRWCTVRQSATGGESTVGRGRLYSVESGEARVRVEESRPTYVL